MKIIVQFSGGKDSLASLLWAVEKYGQSVKAVFCDTEWEHETTYSHIHEVTQQLEVELITLKPKRGFLDLAKHKGRFPSTKARFCTEELKVKPFIDWILSNPDNYIIIQGMRADESAARAKKQPDCNLFRYYVEPYGTSKKGKPQFHTYRKKEVLVYKKQYATDIIRPFFYATALDVFEYIHERGFKANSLYEKGFKRVGCLPCIMCTHSEVKQIIKHFPEVLEKIRTAESETNRTFFSPDYIPTHACTNNHYPTIQDVEKYISGKNQTIEMYPEKSCESYYSTCE